MMEKTDRSAAVRSPRKGVYILPNLMTTASLFCGFLAILSSYNHNFLEAAIAVVAAFFFDGLDGRIARVTRTTSDFGIQYDSLADLISFGVAPAFLMYCWALDSAGRLGWLAAFLFTTCGALRLARFNVQTKASSSHYFKGLPIPSAAGVLAGLVLFAGEIGWRDHPPYMPVVVTLYILSFLMVSSIPYYSFKKMTYFRRKPFQALVGCVLALIVIAAYPPVTLFTLAVAYTLSGPLGFLLHLRRVPVPKEEETS